MCPPNDAAAKIDAPSPITLLGSRFETSARPAIAAESLFCEKYAAPLTAGEKNTPGTSGQNSSPEDKQQYEQLIPDSRTCNATTVAEKPHFNSNTTVTEASEKLNFNDATLTSCFTQGGLVPGAKVSGCDNDKYNRFIGVSSSTVGQSGKKQEGGGRYKEEDSKNDAAHHASLAAKKVFDEKEEANQQEDFEETPAKMYVINRRGNKEVVSFDKILDRIQKLSYGLHSLVDPPAIAQTVINGMYSGVHTSELDELAAQTCAYMAGSHPDFSKLAARIAISNLHKNTEDAFDRVIERLYRYVDKYGRNSCLIADDVYQFIKKNAAKLNAAIDYQRDFEYDYFAFKTLERSYLLRLDNKVAERPQQLLMRVACGIHTGDIEHVLETYDLMSRRFFTHATPTLFNAGTLRPQMSSCFLLAMQEDSIDGIFSTLRQCALISKTAGGIGLAIHCIRATDSYIRGTNGRSNGLVPMLRVYNDTARYVDQGGGKRKGSFAMYLEPWHADILEFLDLKKNHGKEEQRARDLFYALWIPDLFMRRVEANGDWTLMCPNECPGLFDCWGEEFDTLYERYEREQRGRKTIKAQTLWFAILQAQIETGNPFMLYKDACNRKSNHQHLGTIKSSNLCTEVVQYTDRDEVAVCNLASVTLPKFVDREAMRFNFAELHRVTKVVTRNLDKVIDRNYYPIPEAERSNQRHRPIGIGVQGLADAFAILRLPYESPEAKQLNKDIFETLYHAAVEASVELAAEKGVYETYKGSPASQGILQFDMWNAERRDRNMRPISLSGMWDWEDLRRRMLRTGLRNSLLVAPMPTASTSQILGNNESFEPYTSNIYYRRVLSGEFFVVNPHLLRDLIARDLWTESIKQKLIAANGSVQQIPEIPSDLKELYRTVWEIKQKSILDMAADRGAFIDQSQSLNIHLIGPTFAKLSSMHFYGWRLGLKTGMYYLRTTAAADAVKFTVDPTLARSSSRRTDGATSYSNSGGVSSSGATSNSSSSSSVTPTPVTMAGSRAEAEGRGPAPDPREKIPIIPPSGTLTASPSVPLAASSSITTARSCPLLRRRSTSQDELNETQHQEDAESACEACSG